MLADLHRTYGAARLRICVPHLPYDAAVNAPTTLAATWREGLFVFTDDTRHQELPGQAVRALAADGRGGALAIVGEHTLRRRAPDGSWSIVATADAQLSCTLAVGDVLYVGTDDARLLRIRAGGAPEPLRGFDAAPGRDGWYAGTAVVDGREVGPPLGVRSLAATADGRVLLANVHVGGIPRSTDGGASWEPTIAVDADVHEVRAHPDDPAVVIAAAAVGLCVSRDAGATWAVERDGLHATYCSAVAFSSGAVLVAATTDHFARDGAVYGRLLDGTGPLVPLGAGEPLVLAGIADTGCIASRASALAVADTGGNLFVSADAGRNWTRRADDLPAPSGILVV